MQNKKNASIRNTYKICLKRNMHMRCCTAKQQHTVQEIREHLQEQKVNSDDMFFSWGSFCDHSHQSLWFNADAQPRTKI